MRLIDADALLDNINERIENMTSVGVAVDCAYLWALIYDEIKEAPTIEEVDECPQNDTNIGTTDKCDKCFYKRAIKDFELFGEVEPSGDLISRQKAIKTVQDIVIDKEVIEAIKALPSADRPQVNSNSAEEQIAETCDRPKGEWIDREDSTDMFFLYRYECSVCGGKNVFNSSYCPNCGAHMR